MEAKLMDFDLDIAEDQILARIVDAMMDAEAELQDADIEDWSEILRASCRQQKLEACDDLLLATAAC